MLLAWIGGVSILVLLLFVLALFIVTLSYTNDVEISYMILVDEIKDAFFMRKNKKIEFFRNIINNERLRVLKKIVKTKDSDLMKILSIDKEKASEFKSMVQQDIKEKQIFFMSHEDAKKVMEQEDILSFMGSYKAAIEVFSIEKNRVDFKQELKKNKSKNAKKFEEVYEYQIHKENNSITDLFNGHFKAC
ncbi:hypothetical protein [Enterococcus caccae]|uniref:Uncharacterized protein n=1 Tax=Enterococcus caccae ATCC BAA-1240 TaxID=1158612 RepID=R3TW46_9ENTE|nr:hypothetical protein [Enterococcus caccae]EOL45834.1 hypothetical protein UC7_01631 [Enterococcus caccae ATCC BAA-1240]EOT61030.1 hypothetical protein I580_01932 [Enterococcus caccae ATCC BAA-1240]OJG27940.1 hypothetical protein RU98_GL002149 [Enterococcus caccae]